MKRQRKVATGYFVTFLYTLGAAVVTGLLLFLNGGLVMALLNAGMQGGPEWIHKKEFMQFTLFCGPVLLVIVEWMMLDFIRSRLRRSP